MEFRPTSRLSDSRCPSLPDWQIPALSNCYKKEFLGYNPTSSQGYFDVAYCNLFDFWGPALTRPSGREAWRRVERWRRAAARGGTKEDGRERARRVARARARHERRREQYSTGRRLESYRAIGLLSARRPDMADCSPPWHCCHVCSI